jgi:putative transposase
MNVNKSSYYYWLSQRAIANEDSIAPKVESIFWANKQRYGVRRVHKELEYSGEKISLYKVRKVFQWKKLKAIQPRSFVPKTTNSYHRYTISPNLLKETVFPVLPNKVWVGDITYIPMSEGRWCYLSVWMDLFSRRIIGWHLSDNLKETIVIEALRNAVRFRGKIEKEILVHSDRGGQYCGNDFRSLLAKHDMKQSMSDADNPYDNAFMESCFSRFKAELIQTKLYSSLGAAKLDIFEYIEGYYNRVRLHSSLNYRSPEFYENNIHTNLQKEKSSKKEKSRFHV